MTTHNNIQPGAGSCRRSGVIPVKERVTKLAAFTGVIARRHGPAWGVRSIHAARIGELFPWAQACAKPAANAPEIKVAA